jgi:hypothetical protein
MDRLMSETTAQGTISYTYDDAEVHRVYRRAVSELIPSGSPV